MSDSLEVSVSIGNEYKNELLQFLHERMAIDLSPEIRSLTFKFSSQFLPYNELKERALNYLMVCLETKPPNGTDYHTIKTFHSEFEGVQYPKPNISSFTKYELQNIPYPYAALFIEAYCPDQNPATICHADKRISQKTIFYPCLVSPLPIAFQSNGSSVTISFADIDQIQAKLIYNQFIFAYNVFNTVRVIYASFSHVNCKKFNYNDTKELSQRLKMALLRTDPTPDNPNRFLLWALMNAPGRNLIQKFKDCCQEIFDRIKLDYCPNCNSLIEPNTDSPCLLYLHNGQRIPFEDGQMEHIEYFDEGPMTIVNYDCCGECALDSPGCQEILNESHKHEVRATLEFHFYPE